MENRYALSSRIFHWLMALIILGLLGIGIYMTNFLSKESLNRDLFYSLHKSFGVIAIFLIILRIGNRIAKKAPKLPNTMLKYEIVLSHLGHFGLYLLMIIVPISGYLMSNSYGYAVKLFSFEMPFLVGTDYGLGKLFSTIHEYGAYLLIALIVIHIAAVIKHRFFDKPENDVLQRML